MINLTDQIKQDLSSNVNNFDLLVHINSSGQNYYLGTRSATIDGNYYDDVITKIGGAKESIDLRKKKIKLSGTSITINNAEINGKRFSDKVKGEMFGGVVDIYIKTQSCTELNHCKRISSLQISGVTHDSLSINLKCEDKYIEEFHKELPLSEHTLYENVNTFLGDNERRIPILYGHLRQAPAVVYVEDMDSQSPFTDGNILIVPDRAFQDDYDIVGIKPISPFAEIDSPPNQLVEQDVLNIKLGDSAANVYSTRPDRLHRELEDGNIFANYEFKTEFHTQFAVSENKDYINLFTESHEDAPDKIASGNLFCGEVSKLIGVKTFKVRVYRADNSSAGADHNFFENEFTMGHYTGLDTFLDSTAPSPENFDMLSLPAFHLNDTSTDGYNANGIENGIKLGYNTENWIFEALLDIDLSTGAVVFVYDLGFHFNFDIPTFELEFEPLKASADQSKGKEDSYSDANIIGSFRHQLKTISQSGLSASNLQRYHYNIYPAQANQKTENTITKPYVLPDDITTIAGEETMSVDILGIPSEAYGGSQSGGSENVWHNFEDWWNHYNDKHLRHFFYHLSMTSPFIVSSDISLTAGDLVEDYRHTFHTTQQLGDEEDNKWNTWRNWYKLVERTNWLSQNIYTGMVIPEFLNNTWSGNAEKLETALNTTFNGMSLKRSWYQKEVFNENFFVNAKGKYKQMPNIILEDNSPQIMYGENLTMFFVSSAVDTESEAVARTTPDHALLQLIDYLTKNRFEKHYDNGKEYELVITGSSLQTQFEQPLMFFDFDISDFRANDAAPDISSEEAITYQFCFNSKIYRQVPFEFYSWWEFEDDAQYIYDIKLRYARRNIDSSGRITSWRFLEDEGVSSPFSVINDEGEVETRQLIEFENDESVDNKYVLIYLSSYNILGEDDPSTEDIDEEVGVHTIPVIYTNIEDVKELISKPSDVVQDIVSRELGLSSDIVKKDIFDSNYKLDFSVDKTEEGIDVMQKIAECSPFFYKNETATGIPSIVGLNHLYVNSSVDKKINVNQIFKYKLTKTKKEDVALKCRVKYGYDYVAEEYKKVTPDVEHSNPSDYISYYDIKDEESFILEHEAPYIQDKVTAEMLARHLFEVHKNQHLNISFQLPLGDALALEVGDIISFIDNNGHRTNIDGVKPFGKTIKSLTFLNGQAVFPYFMITSISKDLTKSDIVVTQLHELAPSEYDDWALVAWEDYVLDEITGDMIAPPDPDTNEPPYIDWIYINGVDSGPFYETLDFNVVFLPLDTDGHIIAYQYQITNSNTGELITPYADNTMENPALNQPLNFSFTLPDWGNYYLSIKVYDDQYTTSQEVSLIQCIEYESQSPTATISYVSGNDEEGYLDDLFNEGQVIVSTDNDDLEYEFELPYTEGTYEITLSAGQSLTNIPPQDLTYNWTFESDEDTFTSTEEEISFEIEEAEGGAEISIDLTVTNADGLSENLNLYFNVLEEDEEEEEEEEDDNGEVPDAPLPQDVIGIDFPEPGNSIEIWDIDEETGDINIYNDYINFSQSQSKLEMSLLDGDAISEFGAWRIEQRWFANTEHYHQGDSGESGLADEQSWNGAIHYPVPDGGLHTKTIVDVDLFESASQWSWYNRNPHLHEFYYVVILVETNGEENYSRRINYRFNTSSLGGRR